MFDHSGTIAELATAIAQIHTEPRPQNVLPPKDVLNQARERLVQHLPAAGLGLQEAIRHIREELAPGFNASSRSSNYYGFVTGGSTPAASLADNLVTAYDQNVQVHLPEETIATDLEDRTLSLLCELLKLDPAEWTHRTFSTGATASNILGLACGRESVVKADSISEMGIFDAMRQANISKIQVVTTVAHSSLKKAAGILGIGRANVQDVGLASAPHRFDLELLKTFLETKGSAKIVAVSASEVNTGLFATSGRQEMEAIRKLCDENGAWLHVDAAFGIMGRLLTSPEYNTIIQGCDGLELADSITGDAHKLLNVPYDCGFFLSRHPDIARRVFTNPNAAYLGAGGGSSTILSPLNIGLENSRRLRALPVYASLTAYGRDGYREMLERQIQLARGIANFILEHDHYELLPRTPGLEHQQVLSNIYIIVLFRAKNPIFNSKLVDMIKNTRKIYVSGTAWENEPACRFAVSNWMADVGKDLPVIEKVLTDAVIEFRKQGTS